MSALQTIWTARLDKDFADCRGATSASVPREADDSHAPKNVSECEENQGIPMTLITPCESPRHSPWHLASGLMVVVVTYCVAVALVRWFVS